MVKQFGEKSHGHRRCLHTLLIAHAVVLGVSCGGSSPTTPSAPPTPANLVSEGDLRFPSCSSIGCSFEGEARNRGTGCATNVRGITRVFDNGNQQLDSKEWTLSRTRRIQPNEAFVYSGCCFRGSDVDTPGYYRTEIFWDNVACS